MTNGVVATETRETLPFCPEDYVDSTCVHPDCHFKQYDGCTGLCLKHFKERKNATQ